MQGRRSWLMRLDLGKCRDKVRAEHTGCSQKCSMKISVEDTHSQPFDIVKWNCHPQNSPTRATQQLYKTKMNKTQEPSPKCHIFSTSDFVWSHILGMWAHRSQSCLRHLVPVWSHILGIRAHRSQSCLRPGPSIRAFNQLVYSFLLWLWDSNFQEAQDGLKLGLLLSGLQSARILPVPSGLANDNISNR